MRSQMVAVWFCDVAECSSVSVIRAAEVTDWVGEQEMRILNYILSFLCCRFHWCTTLHGRAAPHEIGSSGRMMLMIDVCDLAHALRPITKQL